MLTTCPACADPIGGGDDYCENCGLRLTPVPSGDAGVGRDRVEAALGPLAGVSDIGLRHHRNEDAMALLTPGARSPALVGVVCDGVSSAPRSDDAALVAAETGAAETARALREGAPANEAAATGMTRAAGAVAALADAAGSPACTYVAACMPEGGGPVTVAWIGDSRAYWLPGGGAPGPARLLTRDDSWSAAMVEGGVLSEEEAENSLYAHAITAWLGADSGEVEGHVATVALEGPGAVVLCTDGLWNYAPAAEDLAALLPGAERDPAAAARRAVEAALEAGGRDNVTVVVMSV
ncbi:PP2C family protein-serine/threonine phosphatase [Nocardiopsis suaedae]|uniref:Protein phosphatase 2C domain-containing protein n=1 Tax=Nocardiopsis suaedae TaxID=3018444 RepID=A0ABT4TFN3_9ACTN|nr:protein phosphatase 2C domain-containing protein [Nocardiopsis suaedae]MDA2803515.1 protein phosphatase 2C domain-containing protein [Nocardiopsis suaedae]